MTPARSTSGITRCAGCTRNGWCESWTRLPTSIVPRGHGCAAWSGPTMPVSRLTGSSQAAPGCRVAHAVRSYLPAPHRFRHAGPAAQAAACQQGGVADGAGPAADAAEHQRIGERHPAATSPAARSAPEPAATTAGTAAMRFSVWPRPATSLASRYGTIWAAGSRWQGTLSFSRSIAMSEGASGRPDRRAPPTVLPLLLGA
jgi:hypothetical protein